MSHGDHPTRLPRAGIDPIADDATALALVRLAVCPNRPETVLVLLDGHRRGIGLVVVAGTTAADAVVDVVDRLLRPTVHGGHVASVVVGSVRPGQHHGPDDLADADRWLALDDVADHHGVELVEWYVIVGTGISRPRQLVNAPPRW